MAIRMRINNNKDSHCFNCNTTWINTPVMYDLSIGYEHKQKILPVCKKCIDELFTKTLKASTMWDAKVKTKEDQERIRRSKQGNMPKGEPWSVSKNKKDYEED